MGVQDIGAFQVCPTGGLTVSLDSSARFTRHTQAYAALVQTVRTSPMVVADETGWRVHAKLQWLWVCVTPTTTVYAILPGRGFEELVTVDATARWRRLAPEPSSIHNGGRMEESTWPR